MSPNALEAFLLPLLKQVYEALSFLHERNIGHGDVKNENLLLNTTGTELRLIDFGLSYKISETTDPHLLVVGKEKHDVWSAAVVFAGIIVGKANNPREWDCNGNISSGNEKISCQDYLQLIENRITGDILALFRLLLIDNPAQCISAKQVLDSLMNLYGSE